MKDQNLGSIQLTAKGLRALAKSMEIIYAEKTILNIPVWRSGRTNFLFLQLSEGTGEIDLVNDIFAKD